MVYKRFSWPYGGSEVFLSGSFNGWTNRIRMTPMTPVEGSSTIFMIICDLPPGYHQYKFLVNGVWQIDNQQRLVQDENGAINNLIHVEISESTSSSFDNGIYDPNMMIDNTASTRLLLEMQLLDTDKDVFQRNIFMHLSSQKIFHLMPESGKVYALDDEIGIKDAFHIMHEQGLHSVPIMDGNHRKISGMLTSSDFIMILIELNRARAMLTDEQVELHSISTWKQEKSRFYGERAVAAELMFRNTLIQATPDESIKDLALKILQNKISSLPIVHSMSDGSCPQLLHVACLGGILKYICTQLCSHLNYLPILSRPIGSLHLGTWTSKVGGASRHLLTVHPTEVLGSTLNLLLKAQVSSLPIVNSDGTLVNVYCRSDITSLAKNDAYVRVQLDGTILTQALELVNGQRFGTCTRSDPLCVVMERLSNPDVRRLVVVETGTNRVEGIITLRDVFTFILG